ncbi:nitroreductase [Dysgonomonas sp. OttesenSCG-928-M03]|nr:nitroreductase [Dysgonomonas sp. OttesenSCG-928-M03]
MKKIKLFLLLIIMVQIQMQAQNKDFMDIIEAAAKAPSGHNTQPWLFSTGENNITIYPNMNDTLPVVDSSNRELFISLGAATENLCIKASQLGYKTEVKPDAVSQTIKILLVKENIDTDPLVEYIEKRQTNRKVYNNRIISADVIATLEKVETSNNISRYIIEKQDTLFNVLRTYVEKGNQAQMNDKDFKEELLRFMRFNGKQVKNNPTGLSHKVIGSPGLPGFIAKPIVKTFLKPDKQNKSDLKKIDSSSHFVLFTTQNNTFEEWVNIGRDLERFVLTTTRLGLANAYMNQPCEVESLASDMQNNISLIKGEYPTLLLRIGYADPAAYSVRKKMDDILIKE